VRRRRLSGWSRTAHGAAVYRRYVSKRRPAPTALGRAATVAHRRLLGEAIRVARGDVSQAALGERVGVPQTTVSRWEAGGVGLTLDQVVTLEHALSLPPGGLLRAAGYVADDEGGGGVEAAVRADGRLDPALRDELVALYRLFVRTSGRLSRRRAPARSEPSTPRAGATRTTGERSRRGG